MQVFFYFFTGDVPVHRHKEQVNFIITALYHSTCEEQKPLACYHLYSILEDNPIEGHNVYVVCIKDQSYGTPCCYSIYVQRSHVSWPRMYCSMDNQKCMSENTFSET